MIDFVKVGMRISEYRRKRGLSQEELADLLFVTRQALSKWERGISIPSIDTLAELSRLFGVSFEEILGIGKETVSVDEEDIFRGHDRSFIINGIVKGEIKVRIPEVFYQMSPKERILILKYIKEGKLDCDKESLYPRLTPHERRFMGLN